MSAELIAKLIEAGTPAPLVAEIAMALSRAAVAVETIEARRSKDRERKRVPRISVDSVEIQESPSPQSPPLKSPPDPQKITPPLTPQPTMKMRARRLPDDWQPEPLTGQAQAMVACWQDGEIKRQLAKFRNHWLAKAGGDACKTDWQRTWVNWLITTDERKPKNGPQHYPHLGKSAQAFAMLNLSADEPF